MKFEMTEADFNVVMRALGIASSHEKTLAQKALEVMPEASIHFVKAQIAIEDVAAHLGNQFTMFNKEERKA